jgi:hypothetical protein
VHELHGKGERGDAALPTVARIIRRVGLRIVLLGVSDMSRVRQVAPAIRPYGEFGLIFGTFDF